MPGEQRVRQQAAPARDRRPLMIRTIPLNLLMPSPRNVRRVADPQADLQLKADIEAPGLLSGTHDVRRTMSALF